MQRSNSSPDPQALADARDLLNQLSKALRTVRLYDRQNEIVDRFLENLRQSVRGFHGKWGAFSVRVLPTTFAYSGEEIQGSGLDELALAMFRQGLVTLAINESVGDQQLEELVILLGEGLLDGGALDDDLVTRLWRADLPGVTYTSVLGYQEADGSDDQPLEADDVQDTLQEMLQVDLEQVSENVRAALDRQKSLLSQQPDELPPELASFVAGVEAEQPLRDLHPRLLETLRDALLFPGAEGLISEKEARGLLGLALDSLVEDHNLKRLAHFTRLLQALLDPEACPDFPYRQMVREFMDSGLRADQIRDLLRSLPEGPAAHEKYLGVFLPAMAGQLKLPLAEQLDTATGADREFYQRLLAHVCRDDHGFMAERVKKLRGAPLVQTLRVLHGMDPRGGRNAFVSRLASADLDTLEQLLRELPALEGLYNMGVREALIKLGSRPGPVRALVADALRRQRDGAAVKSLWGWVRGEDYQSWDSATVEAVFRALMGLTRDGQAEQLAEKILGRKGLLGFLARRDLQLSVTAALGSSNSARAVALLKQQLAGGHKDLQRAAKAALAEIRSRVRRRRSTSAVPPGEGGQP